MQRRRFQRDAANDQRTTRHPDSIWAHIDRGGCPHRCRTRATAGVARAPKARRAKAIDARLVVIAGANGAGKSTYSASYRDDGLIVIDPDTIARDEQLSAVGAGRVAVQRIRHALASNTSFGMETTLSGHLPFSVMRDAAAREYRVSLVFIGTGNVETNVRRIRDRVALGGHDVPEADVRRRYTRGLQNLRFAVERANDVALYDNSETAGFVLVAISHDTELIATQAPPAWLVEASINVTLKSRD